MTRLILNHPRPFVRSLALITLGVVSLLTVSASGQAGASSGWRPVPAKPSMRLLLDDIEISKKFQAAREYNLSKIVYHESGNFLDCTQDIGPPGQPHTLAGMEFPWKHPGGTFKANRTRKFVWPADVRCKTGTIRVLGYGNDNGSFPRMYPRPGWVWPEGTTLFELHYHDRGWPFELRVLEKDNNGFGFENYTARVFRPVSSEDELPFKITGRTEKRVVTSDHPMHPFKSEGEVTVYPDVRFDWNRFVRTTVWGDDTGHDWHHTGQGNGWLSPKGYQGWMVGSDENTCVECHGTTGVHTSYFEAMRDWYGFVPGMDGLMSFDPIDRRSVKSYLSVGQGGFKWKNN